MAELLHIFLASFLSIVSSLMHTGTKSLQGRQLPPVLQLGPVPAAAVSNRLVAVAVVVRHPQAVVLVVVAAAVAPVVLQAAVAVAKAVVLGMALAEAIKLAVAARPQLGLKRHRQTQNRREEGVRQDSRPARLSQQAAGQQLTMAMCGTCLSGYRPPPWLCLLRPWGTSICSTLARPILQVLLPSCRYVHNCQEYVCKASAVPVLVCKAQCECDARLHEQLFDCSCLNTHWRNAHSLANEVPTVTLCVIYINVCTLTGSCEHAAHAATAALPPNHAKRGDPSPSCECHSRATDTASCSCCCCCRRCCCSSFYDVSLWLHDDAPHHGPPRLVMPVTCSAATHIPACKL